MTNLNTQALFAEITAMGSADPIVKGQKPYEAKTVGDVRKNVLDRIEATINALNSYEDNGQSIKDNPLVSPMARRVRNGYQVKIGYGTRNEALIHFTNSKGETVSSKNFATIEETNQFLNKVEDFVSAKGLDEAIEKKLQSYRDRADLAKTARMNQDNENVVPMAS
jgi:hypothetical protein